MRLGTQDPAHEILVVHISSSSDVMAKAPPTHTAAENIPETLLIMILTGIDE